MRVLVTGAGGQLAHDLERAFAGDEFLALDHAALDVSSEPAVWAAVRDYAPQAVINAAALAGMEACEADPGTAWAVNAGGASNVARACEAADVWLVHVSCGSVFDGTLDRPYTEFDRPAPHTMLGRSKEAGEQLVRLLCPDHQIVRTAWLQGAHGSNFVKSMLSLAREHGRAKALTDQVGTPTFAADLAPALRRLVVNRRPGTYHVTNTGVSTWHQLAAEAFRLAGLDIEPMETVAAANGPLTPTPANHRLEGRNTQLAGLDPLPDWQDGLSRLITELAK